MTELAPHWTLTRLVWDGLAQRCLRGSGTAQFSRISADDWRMREELFFDGRDAHRETGWSLGEKELSIRFADGLPLVTLALTDVPSEAWHLCGEDRYRARLIQWSAESIRLGWRVLGPRKDYVMLTRYFRNS